MRIGNSRFIALYRGAERSLFSSGPNWWQITMPPGKWWPWARLAFIRWHPRS
jgi:hypothetical protein